jgi:hypothetical protein
MWMRKDFPTSLTHNLYISNDMDYLVKISPYSQRVLSIPMNLIIIALYARILCLMPPKKELFLRHIVIEHVDQQIEELGPRSG